MKKIISISIVAVLLLIYFFFSSAEGNVVSVADGDTFKMLNENKEEVRIRIYGIDAPEKGQAFNKKSKKYLSDMIAGKKVTVQVIETDRYGRSVAKVCTDKVEDVGLEMIKAGLAWHYSYYDQSPEYAKAEQDARKNKIGLWTDANPVNPYEYRKKGKKVAND